MKQFSPYSLTRLISCRSILIYSALFSLLVSQQSCAGSADVNASFDYSNEKESGPSMNDNTNYPGPNLFVAWMTGASRGDSRPLALDDHGLLFNNDGKTANSMYRADNPAPQPEGFALRSTVQFIVKGSGFDGGHTHLDYLEGLEDVVYQKSVGGGAMVFGGLGPYIAYGIGGKASGGGFSESAFGGDGGYKRFDAGLHLIGGYRLPSSLNFSLGYEYGLVDKSADPSDVTSRNRTLSVNVGYSLQKIINAIGGKK